MKETTSFFVFYESMIQIPGHLFTAYMCVFACVYVCFLNVHEQVLCMKMHICILVYAVPASNVAWSCVHVCLIR